MRTMATRPPTSVASAREAVTHGARADSPHSPSRTRQIARAIWAATASAMPLPDAASSAAASTASTSSTSAAYSSVDCPCSESTTATSRGARHGTTTSASRTCASAVTEPRAGDEVAEHDEVAAVDRHDLPVAAPQRARRPPAVLDEPRLAHADDLVAVDLD